MSFLLPILSRLKKSTVKLIENCYTIVILFQYILYLNQILCVESHLINK